MPRVDTVLILGSAPDVVRAREWRREGIDAIVAINNAWKVRSDWDRLVHPKDFPPDRRPTDPRPHQRVHSYPDYVPAVNAYGGFGVLRRHDGLHRRLFGRCTRCGRG